MRDRWLWAFLAVAVLGVTLFLFLPDDSAAGASSLSKGPTGWLAARLYLEERGADVTVMKKPLNTVYEADDAAANENAPDDPGVWVLTTPMQRFFDEEEWAALDRHLMNGGTLLVTYPLRVDLSTRLDVLEHLGLYSDRDWEEVPLAPWSWWAYRNATWEPEPAEGWPDEVDAPALFVPACRRPPSVPTGAQVLYRSPEMDDAPLVFSFQRQRGRVVVVPSVLFANAWLREADNADLLETLYAWLGPRWLFDEYHHGLVDPAYMEEDNRSAFAWDLFMFHLLLLYVVSVLALVRRFGPAWSEPTVTAGSTAAFLRNLGTLHRELGHGPDAARLLVERSRALDPSFEATDVADPALTATQGQNLVEFARRVAAKRKRRLHG